MTPCISTIICLLDSPNTVCHHVETVVGFTQRHDLIWDPILILNWGDKFFKSLVRTQWFMALYLLNGSIDQFSMLYRKKVSYSRFLKYC
jgi:hypothetical protein